MSIIDARLYHVQIDTGKLAFDEHTIFHFLETAPSISRKLRPKKKKSKINNEQDIDTVKKKN